MTQTGERSRGYTDGVLGAVQAHVGQTGPEPLAEEGLVERLPRAILGKNLEDESARIDMAELGASQIKTSCPKLHRHTK